MPSKRFIRNYRALCMMVLALIALGGSVRAMNAGLACPDWPLCFGDFIPDYHPQVYFEFLHRVLAGLVALVIVVMNMMLIRNKNITKSIKNMCWFSFVVLITQIILGGLTVIMQLHAKVVTLHLTLGMMLMSSVAWIYFSIAKPEPIKKQPDWMITVSIFTLLVIAAQIVLGGLVASHYAALVCTDFPLCHGQFIPTFKGIIGLQVSHRLGAYFTTFVVVVFSILVWVNSTSPKLKKCTTYVFLLLFLQMGLGIANVVLLTPPLITVAHLTVGTLILVCTLKVVHLQMIANQKA